MPGDAPEQSPETQTHTDMAEDQQRNLVEKEASCPQAELEQLNGYAQSNGPQTLLITRRTVGPKQEIRDRGLGNAFLNSSRRP